jgi:phosphoribosylamine--glycine ligase
VLKADGLAAGKGVIIAQTHDEAIDAFTEMIKHGQFGDAGKTVVVEQFLDGIELSVFAFSDGTNFVLLPEAKDYKRIGEGDTGLNTGGMGAISPVPFADAVFMQQVKEQIILPTVNGLKHEGITYKGFIFFGLIKVNGAPYVIEYNCRMGDPETEVVMPRLKNDLVEMIIAMEKGDLNTINMRFDARSAATVMLVAGGYPGHYEKGNNMSGFGQTKGSLIFHAGTIEKDGNILSNGGRLVAISSYGDTLKDALNISYKNATLINYEGKYYRRDIGYEFS